MKRITHKSEYFYGHKISPYGLERGYLDYSTLAKAFNAVLVNDITKLFYSTLNGEYIEPEQVNGYIDNSEEIEELQEQIEELQEQIDNLECETDEDITEYKKIEEQIEELQEQIEELEEDQEYQPEIYQYYIVSDNGAEILQHYTNDPVYYIDALDVYVWGVTHYGTSWSYVLTDVKLDRMEE